VTLLAITVLYAIPRTAVLGALLLSLRALLPSDRRRADAGA
jgi:hypothetical protein